MDYAWNATCDRLATFKEQNGVSGVENARKSSYDCYHILVSLDWSLLLLILLHAFVVALTCSCSVRSRRETWNLGVDTADGIQETQRWREWQGHFQCTSD